ncbi:hypothetical protein [Maribacter sp. 2308TA10-17]|uniref:hypothetical protein n=1 Tax=Maribacter sp. 2308TA10-17 TaxID=3386276 RepID=UPI0039BCB017
MKKYEVYKNIRKGAVIFGLPLPLFALLMICVVASLLVIIFSFSLAIIIGALLFNGVLYTVLMRISSNPRVFHIARPFPKLISNKKSSQFHYEEN